MRPNNRQRPRGGRGGGGGGGGGGGPHHHKQHHNNPNRPPNRNQLFDSSGPDVRVRGNAHQVFDKYQALAREAGSSGDRILAEAYWQYAEHYFRMIQSMGGGFAPRNNWGEGPEDGQQQQGPEQQGSQNGPQNGPNNGPQNNPPQQNGANGHQQQNERQGGPPPAETADPEPGLGGVAFLQSGRGSAGSRDPAADEQPEIPEFPTAGRRP